MDLGLQGRVALITAASQGLGLASAQALAAEGCRVAICARRSEPLEAARTTLGDGVLALPMDITAPDAPDRMVQATVEHFGGLDVLVANAGGPPPMRALDVTDDTIAAAVNANATTSIRLVQAALPHMRDGGWGRICCITSAAVKQPIPTLALSNLARTGLWAWAKTAAADLFAEGITLNLACPGLHATERIKGLPVGDAPVGDPADFGKVVAFLCSEPARFISGTAVLVDGAASVGLL